MGLEAAVLGLVVAKAPRLFITGTCDTGMSASATTIVCANLAGYGDDYFNSKFWMTVIKNANSVGAAPEKQYRQITDYVSATGTFTVTAFSTNVEEVDEVLLLHETFQFTKKQEYTTGSGNWTCPEGVYEIDAVIVAGGANGEVAVGAYAGGGGGEVVVLRKYPVTPLASYAYAVGAAGANSSFDGIVAEAGTAGGSATTQVGGIGGGTHIGAEGGVGGTTSAAGGQGKSAGGGMITRNSGGGGGGGNAGSAGGNSFFATGGAVDTNRGGGGASWKSGPVGGSAAAANSGAGGGSNAAGGTGYILISWK